MKKRKTVKVMVQFAKYVDGLIDIPTLKTAIYRAVETASDGLEKRSDIWIEGLDFESKRLPFQFVLYVNVPATLETESYSWGRHFREIPVFLIREYRDVFVPMKAQSRLFYYRYDGRIWNRKRFMIRRSIVRNVGR